VGVTSLYAAGYFAAAEAACSLAASNSEAAQLTGQILKGARIGGHVVGAGENVYDIYENGANGKNVLSLTMHVLGAMDGFNSCFIAGTQIVVGMEYDADGNFVSYVTVNIEDVKVGDLVYSYDTATGEVSQKAVTSTSALRSDHINYLTIIDENGNEQTIETTDAHPFWVVTNNPDLERAARDYVFENGVWLYHENVTPTEYGYWVEAKDLRVGDVFLGVNGELSTLTNIVRVEQDGGIAVFNFKVEGNHNYYILAKEYEYGQSCILVHNADCDLPMQRHHFATDKNQKFTPEFEDILDKYGLDLDDDWNTGMLPHLGRHPEEYHDFVLQEMINSDTIAGGDVDTFLAEFKERVVDVVSATPEMVRTSFWRD